VPHNFSYSSETNDNFLSVEDLKILADEYIQSASKKKFN